MNKVDCEIIIDLLPLYVDDVCSYESKKLIENHIRECSKCRKILESIKEEPYISEDIVEKEKEFEEGLKRIRKKILIKEITIGISVALFIGFLWVYFSLFKGANPYGNPLVTDISSLDDVMYYFRYAFFPYIVLFIIVLYNFIKAFYILKKESEIGSKNFILIDFIIDILCGVGMGAGLMFQGVLADNNAVGYEGWCNGLILISIVSFILFLGNIVLFFKIKGKR